MGQPMQQQVQHIKRHDSGIFLRVARTFDAADDQTLIGALVENDALAWREFQKR